MNRIWLVTLFLVPTLSAAEPPKIDPTVFGANDPRTKELARMMVDDVDRRMKAANLAETSAFEKLKSKQEWEEYRDRRIDALRKSLGTFPAVPDTMNVFVSRTIRGEGFEIQNILYESRPGWYVSANLYLPREKPAKMPGILISHSHHTAKTNGELQDMGMTWARAGCAVLIPDHMGYGERREHPFHTEKDYPAPFRAGRQDYYHRYSTNLMLQSVGESLMGWMAWDLMRGIDVLLKLPNIDSERVILLGSVAGGGDPAGVAAALDKRITCVAPFNFGGWQPESKVLENPARDFAWFGDGYWESTRGLRGGASGGFAHYVILGSVAPRKVIYGHEFAWSSETDPAWPRLQKIFNFYDAKTSIVPVHGSGKVTGQAPESTHCTHIGPVHRKGIYQAFADWFGMPIPKEYSNRGPSEELKCWNEVTEKAGLKRKPLADMVNAMVKEQLAEVEKKLPLRDKEDSEVVVKWLEPLRYFQDGGGRQRYLTVVSEEAGKQEQVLEGNLHRFILKLGMGINSSDTMYRQPIPVGIDIPFFLFTPKNSQGKSPCVVMVATAGKKGFLEQRSEVIEAFLKAGVAVALVDVRGTGESLPGKSGERGSTRTSISQTNLILSTPMFVAQLADLGAVLEWLRQRKDIDRDSLGVWGDSFAEPNKDANNLEVPFDVTTPRIGEPTGALLAEWVGGVKAVYARGGISKTDKLFHSAFLAIPHEAIVPGFAGYSMPMKNVRHEGQIDVRNIRVDDTPIDPLKSAEWMVKQLIPPKP